MEKALLLTKAHRARNMGQTKKALQYASKYISACEEDGDLNGEADGYHLTGILYTICIQEKNDNYFKSAIDYFHKSQSLFLKKKNRLGYARVIADEATAYVNAHEYEKASAIYKKSTAMLMRKHDTLEAGISYVRWGLLLISSSNLKEAEKFVKKGLFLIDKTPEAAFYRATAMLGYAEVMIKVGNIEEAEEKLKDSLDIFIKRNEKNPHPRRIAEIYALLSFCSFRKGDIDMFYFYEKLFKEWLAGLDDVSSKLIENIIAKVCRL